MASSRQSPAYAPQQWFEKTVSVLNRSHPFYPLLSEYVPKTFRIIIVGPNDRSHLPPSHCHCFFLDQLEGGLRIPVPRAYLDILDFYKIINQLAPNAFRILASTVIVFEHLKLPLSPQVFHCLFQLKMTDPGAFYFSERHDYQFLRGIPSSNKGWKSLYVFVQLPSALPHSES